MALAPLRRAAKFHATELLRFRQPVKAKAAAPAETALMQFPLVTTSPSAIHMLEDMVGKHGLPVEKLSYQWSNLDGAGLIKLDCSLTAQSGDIPLRQLLADAKVKFSTLAFEALSVHRANGLAMSGDATLQFALYFREVKK